MTVESKLEALAVVRAAARHDSKAASIIYNGSEHRGALVASLATLTVTALRWAHPGEDVEETLDMLTRCLFDEADA